MLCYILTTGLCNLKCKYCGGSFPEHLVPRRISYTIDELESFLEGVDELVIAFYGGEPLLNPSWIRAVMDYFSSPRYVIQTNGLLLDRLEEDYWRRMDTVLLSIDGPEDVTDGYRGRGVYRAVIRAAERLRSMGFDGDLIARMTISRNSDVRRDVKHLLSLGLFDHVHWQVDAIWSPKWRGFEEWLFKNYIPGLLSLVHEWVEELCSGDVVGIAPFKAIMTSLLEGRSLGAPPCGAGWGAVAINTNGDILSCPIAVDASWAKLGNVRDASWRDVLGKRVIGEPCTMCSYYNVCGGRCLYTHYERLWGSEGFNMMCEATRRLIDALREVKPLVEESLRLGIVSMKDIRYPPYLNSVEVIP